MTYHTGQVVPLDYTRKPFSGPCDPAWFVMVTKRQRVGMVAAAAWMERNGAEEAWFPQQTEYRQTRRGHRMVKEPYDRAIVPGIVFVWTEVQPQWDVLLERKAIRPLQIGTRPVAVTEAVMAQMASVPSRIEEMRNAILAAERAEREARKPVVGGMASVVTGLFNGKTALVLELRRDEVLVDIDGVKVWVGSGDVERRAK